MKNNYRLTLASTFLAVISIASIAGGCQQQTAGGNGFTESDKKQLTAKPGGEMPPEAKAALAKAHSGAPTGQEQSPWSKPQSKP